MAKAISVKILSYLNAAGLALTIAVNALANSLPLNNQTTGAISGKYPNLFVPASVTFSIWGLIYLLLIGFIVYQLNAARSEDMEKNEFIKSIGLLFLLSSFANSLWIFAWHFELIIISFILIILLLVSLAAIYIKIGLIRPDKPAAVKYMLNLPFSIYTGWVTVAVLANLAVVFVDFELIKTAEADRICAVIFIIIATAISLTVLKFRKDVYFSLVSVWALCGIIIKRLSADDAKPENLILTVAAAGVSVILLYITAGIIKRNKAV